MISETTHYSVDIDTIIFVAMVVGFAVLAVGYWIKDLFTPKKKP